MAKIDLEKFICDFLNHREKDNGNICDIIKMCIKDQGLEYKDEQIVEIEYHCTGVGNPKEEEGVLKEMIDKPLEIKAGHWYMCIKNYSFCEHDYPTFEKGKVYKSEKDEELIASDGGKWPFGDAKDYFRPATEDEIPQEPKFKENDWIIQDDGELFQIVSVCNGYYDFIDINDKKYHSSYEQLEQDIRLWTIQDAKDGDVLFVDMMAGYTLIYKGVNSEEAILFSFIVNNDGNDVLPYHIGEPNTGIGTIEDNRHIIYPATKEQQNLLFQKMSEAGYEWDAEKKELRKIQKPDLDSTNGTIKFEDELKHPADGLSIVGPKEKCEDCGSVICNGCIDMKPKENLTEFEQQFKAYMYHPNTDPVILDACCQKLLSLACKQIAREIKVSTMCKEWFESQDEKSHWRITFYRQGILDTLEKIKGEEMI